MESETTMECLKDVTQIFLEKERKFEQKRPVWPHLVTPRHTWAHLGTPGHTLVTSVHTWSYIVTPGHT